MSKVKALLRRSKEQEENDKTLNVGGILINREEYKIIKDNIEIVLPRKEFELLYLLASKPGKVFKREEILDTIWGNDVIVGGIVATKDANGNVVGSATSESSNIESNADGVGNYFVVDDGEKETFRLTVVFNPLPEDEGKSFRMQLLSVNFNDTQAGPDEQWTPSPASSYETPLTFIND